MQLPEWVRTMFLVATGDGWPEADEDGLRALAREWSGVAGAVGVQRQRLDESVRVGRRGGWHGPAAAAFTTAGVTLAAQGGQHLSVLTQGAEELSTFIRDTGVRVEYLKLIVLGQLLMLAAEIAYLVAVASVTFGASTAAIPALQSAGRAFAVSAVRGLVLSIAAGQAMQVGLDASVQALQKFVLHTRRDWDSTLTGTAAVAGAVGGALAPAVGVLGAVVGAALRPVVGRTGAAGVQRVGGGAVHEYGTAVGTGVVSGQGPAGSGWDLSAGATDGATDGAGRLLRRGRVGSAPLGTAGGDLGVVTGPLSGGAGGDTGRGVPAGSAPPADSVGVLERSPVAFGGAGDPSIDLPSAWGRVDLMRPEPPPVLTVTVHVPPAPTGYTTMMDTTAGDTVAGDTVAGDTVARDGGHPAVVVADDPVGAGTGYQPWRGGQVAPPGQPPGRWPGDNQDPPAPARAGGPANKVAGSTEIAGFTEIAGCTDADIGDDDGALAALLSDTTAPTIDQVLRGAAPRRDMSPVVGPVEASRVVDRGPAVGPVAAGPGGPDHRSPQQQRPDNGAKRSAGRAGLDRATGSSSRQGQPRRKRRAAPSGATEAAGPHPVRTPNNVGAPDPSSRPAEAHTTAARPPRTGEPVDPSRPMVVTRNVDKRGRAYLGDVKRDAAGNRVRREPCVGAGWSGKSVDVRFDDTGLSVIVQDHNGRDAVIALVNRPEWELTGEQFSRLPGVRNTDAPLPPPMIDPVDPSRPMVITCNVRKGGRVYLAGVKWDAAGNRVSRDFGVGAGWSGESVDVRFDATGLFVIVQDHNGQDAVMTVVNRPEWELTGEEFSRLPGVRNTDAPLPPPMIDLVDPSRPMVLARKVRRGGRVILGDVTRDAGKQDPRNLYVEAERFGRWVNVRFDAMGLSVTAQGRNGQAAVIPLVKPPEWELTGEQFSRLAGVRNTADAQAVHPAVTGRVDSHPVPAVGTSRSVPAVGTSRSGPAATVTDDSPPARTYPPILTEPRPVTPPGAWQAIEEFLGLTDTGAEPEPEIGDGGMVDELVVTQWLGQDASPWFPQGPSSAIEAGPVSGAEADGSAGQAGFPVRVDADLGDSTDERRPTGPVWAYPPSEEPSTALPPRWDEQRPDTPDGDWTFLDGDLAFLDQIDLDDAQRDLSTPLPTTTTAPTIDQVLRGAAPRRDVPPVVDPVEQSRVVDRGPAVGLVATAAASTLPAATGAHPRDQA